MLKLIKNIVLFLFFASTCFSGKTVFARAFKTSSKNHTKQITKGFTNATAFGFLPGESRVHNTKALQAALEKGGTILISQTGIYKISGTVYVGNNTSLFLVTVFFYRKLLKKVSFPRLS
jgi:hypothetical protein